MESDLFKYIMKMAILYNQNKSDFAFFSRPMHWVSSAIVAKLAPLVYNQKILMAARSVSALDVQRLALRLA